MLTLFPEIKTFFDGPSSHLEEHSANPDYDNIAAVSGYGYRPDWVLQGGGGEVPEPGTLSFLLGGVAALWLMRRRVAAR
jgi:hypothetical protein